MGKRSKSFTDLLETDFRQPKKGDRLIKPSRDWNHAVDFSDDEYARHVHIFTGYMDAAEALIVTCDDDPVQGNFLIYPILSCYRHALELEMKWLIRNYSGHARISPGKYDNHDLFQLRKLTRKIIVNLSSDIPELDFVGQVIKDFHDIDKSNEAFRYSRKRSGVAISLPAGTIDLANIRDVMDGVKHFFTGIDGLLDSNVSAVDW